MKLGVFFVFSYLGPGLDGGVITAVLGILASFFLALFAIIWYPLKRVFKKFRKKNDQ